MSSEQPQSDETPESAADTSQSLPDDAWDQLAECVERFLNAWEATGVGPVLADFLPPEKTTLRRMVLTELIKVDLEYRFSADGPVLKIEDYVAEYPELAVPDGVPAELVFEEYHNRVAAGETIDVTEYYKRFPDKVDELQRLLPQQETQPMTTDGRSLEEAFQPGEHIGDFYLMSRLGTGAFGSVFLARQESMQRLVALKISSDHGTEGTTLAQLDHPNIVRIFDQVRLTDKNLKLLYMQFAAGGTLQSVVRASQQADNKTGRIVAECIARAVEHTGVLSAQSIPLSGEFAARSWAEVTCRTGVDLAEALRYAHGKGILHRDIKPANVLLEANGRARLADFNISFCSATDGSSPAAYFGGSLAYMSPEQLEAFDPNTHVSPDDLDERSDIYSLGVVLWELFFGKRPFADPDSSHSVSELLKHMVNRRRAGVPPAAAPLKSPAAKRLYSILARCLQPNPEDRFQSAEQVSHELALCLQPRVARLLNDQSGGWRRIAADWPSVAFLTTAVAPHIPAAVFNYVYNDQAIIAAIKATVTNPQQAERAFRMTVVLINAVAFSVGIAACLWYLRPVAAALKVRSADGTTIDGARRRALQLSRFVTVVGIAEWTIAGLAYPFILHAVTQGGLQARWHAHFFVSLLVCGLVAAAYPFFLTATLSVRAFMPRLLQKRWLHNSDLHLLQQLSGQSAWSLYLAGGVPAFGIMILLTTQNHEHSTLPLKVFSLLGVFGFALALRLARTLQSNIEALQQAHQILSRDDI